MEKSILISCILVWLLGMGIGIVSTLIFVFKKVNCILQVREGYGRDQFQFVVLCPIDQLKNKRYLIAKVKKGPVLTGEEFDE